MSRIICDTSVLQYLHQLGLLHPLPTRAEGVIVPPAVVGGLADGKGSDVSLPAIAGPDWILVQRPRSAAALPLAADFERGETAVPALALELPETVGVLDDALARRIAHLLDLPMTGTLGLLIEAQRCWSDRRGSTVLGSTAGASFSPGTERADGGLAAGW